MWNETYWHFGVTKAGTILQHTFTHDKTRIIRKTECSCSCVTTKWNRNNLTITWKTPKDIKEFYESSKFVYIHYAQGAMELIELKAQLIP